MGAMENAGCVTLRDEYLPRSRQDRSFYEFRALGDPARDGAHVVRRPGHHEVVGRPVAQRVVRRVGLLPRRRRGHRVRPRPGPASPTPARTGPTARTSCPAPTRSPPTTTTCRPSRSTSTGSPTPRAPRSSSSSSPGSAWTPSSPACGQYFKEHAYGNAEFADLLGALEKSSGRELPTGPQEWLQTSGVNTLTPDFELDEDGTYASFAVAPDRGAGLPDAAPAPHRHRPLRRRGRPPRAPRPRRDRRRRREHRHRRARRRAAARPAAAQRRRPHLRQDPPRRALAGHRRRRPRPARRLAGPGAVLGRGLGHDPRRRDDAPPTSSTWCWPTSAPRPTRSASAGSRATPPRRSTASPPRPTGRPCGRRWEPGLRELLDGRRAGQRPPADLRPGLRRRRPHRPGARRPRGPARRHLDASRASRSTTTCAGRCHGAGPRRPRRRRRDRRRAGRATTPSPARRTPPPPGRPAPPPRPRPRRGSRRWSRDDVPNETHRAIGPRLPGAGQEDVLGAVRREVPRRRETIWERLGTHKASTALEFIFPRPLASPRAARPARRLAGRRPAPTRARTATSGRAAPTSPAPSPPRPRTPSADPVAGTRTLTRPRDRGSAWFGAVSGVTSAFVRGQRRSQVLVTSRLSPRAACAAACVLGEHRDPAGQAADQVAGGEGRLHRSTPARPRRR